ncbi:MAG: cation-transporting P-type ATPase [Mucilaginibacter sp.]|nr:cation-transporting P-type ATPase [Mucilaginibacter sp.]
MKELPFDPEVRRRRVVLRDNITGKSYLVVIGAPEVLLKITQDSNAPTYLNNITEAGKNGLHHIALAYKEINYSPDFDILKHEPEVSFLGFVSMHDPLRNSAKITIEHAKKLGIGIKILSGDSKEVAQYVGRQINLVKEGDSIYTGDELDSLSPEEYEHAVHNCNVFARVSPTQKFNIIKTLQQTNVVAYQGDGINDAPSLKLADVAIAVNTATDIAKEDADIVLLNKSLEVIISGITYGRSLFININKYIKHTMISNFGNFIALAILYLISTDLPLLPIQVLLTTVIADVPLVTIYADSVENEDVTKPEKHNVRSLLNLALFLGVPAALFELLYFFLIRNQPQKEVETSLYVFITFIGLIVFYSIRVKKYFWKAKASPKLINISFILAFVFSFVIIYIPPFQRWFSFVGLGLNAVLQIIGLTLLYFLITDFAKVLYYKYGESEARNRQLLKNKQSFSIKVGKS